MVDNVNRAVRVFVVEDQAHVRYVLKTYLAALGHSVVAEAYKVDAAIKVAAEADYDLAIVDLNLGSEKSYDVVDVVMRSGKALLIVTGYGRNGLNSAYEQCSILVKPYTRAELGRSIQLALGQTYSGQISRHRS